MADTASAFPPNTPPSSAATAGSLSVADFNKLATVPVGGTLLSLGRTATLNLLVTGNYTFTGLPALPGFTALVALSRLAITARTGTATGTLTYGAGNNVTFDNVMSGFTFSAAVANTPPTGSSMPFSLGGASTGGMVDVSTTPLSLNITAPYTGSSVLTGVFYLAIWHVPAPT